MKKAGLLLVWILCLAAALPAQIAKLEVFELGAKAELGLVGTITEVKGGTFTLEVNRVFMGEYSDGQITVSRFRNTKDAKRWAKYLPGQQVLLLLVADGDNWDILGEGGEGEKLVADGQVYLDARGGGVKNQFGYRALPDGSGNIYAEIVELEPFIDAVSTVGSCFSAERREYEDKYGRPISMVESQQLCDEPTLDAFRSKSEVHNMIAEKALSFLAK